MLISLVRVALEPNRGRLVREACRAASGNDDLGKCIASPVFAHSDCSLVGVKSNMDRCLCQLTLHPLHLMQTEEHGVYSVFITITINSIIKSL